MNKPSSRTVPALLAEISASAGTLEAVVDGEDRWRYTDLHQAVAQCARALLASGIQHGDRVGILAGNRCEWLTAYFAAMSIGAIAVGLNTWASARELGYQLDHAAVKLLFLEPQFRERDFIALLSEARGPTGLTALREVIVLNNPPSSGAFADFLRRGDSVSEAALETAMAGVAAENIACLLYTSGSTALPKGVPLLHRGLIDNMWEIGERQHLVAGDRLWLAVSLFWSLACVNALFAVLTHRGTIVLQHHFDAGEALRLIEAERCTIFYGTPNMALALAEHPECKTRNLASLRKGVTIGTAAQVQRIADLGVSRICNVYGLTETYGNTTVTDADLALDRRLQTVGQALAGNRVRIIDAESGADQPIGTTGEIVIHGNVMQGYWNDPVRTAEAFTSDGWFRTGDLGFLDSDGYLYFRGRLKEMVKTGGINVAPAEVEEILATHPAVESAFVTGIPDERFDEALAAVIVLRRGQMTDAETLRAHCREILAAYKLPRHFRFVDATALPLTTTGKLQRNRLAEMFL
jgi:fatty-acyl-CoA synthase